MKKILSFSIISLGLVACGTDERPRDHDNTAKNVRDRSSATLTPLDQSETEADRNITQEIRKALTRDNDLSTNAKNIKIMTINGLVTLRGPVNNVQEKESIAVKVKGVPGVAEVDNQIEILQK